MKTLRLLSAVALACFALNSNAVLAQYDNHDHNNNHQDHSGHDHSELDTAPIGVMGSHLMPKGQWMASYRFMQMHMDGSRIGTDSVSPGAIATSVPNRFAGSAGQPPTLRVVPTEMTTDMHMIGGMYGVTDRLTVMAMGMYLHREMDHLTFAGGAGTNELGRFTTESEGFGDTRVAGLYSLYEDKKHRVHLNAGLSLPTGSITEEDTVLAPNGATPTLRLPYAMQLGSGTFDAMPGITYNGSDGRHSWGAQYMGEIRLEDENSEGYSLGDRHFLTAWGGYQWKPSGAYGLNTTLRLTASTQEAIDGIDPQIVAPVQTADPDNYGGDSVDLGVGVDVTGRIGDFRGQRFSAELSVPLYRDLNGPQLERDYIVSFGWSKVF